MLTVAVKPHLLGVSGRYIGEIEQGEHLDSIVQRFDMTDIERDSLIIEINGTRVPRRLWAYTYPKDMTRVDIVAIYQGGGGGKQILGVVAMLAVTALTGGVGAFLSGTAMSALQIGAVQAGMMMIGTLAVSALFSPPEPAIDGATGEYLTFSGLSNRPRPDGGLMQIFGKIRVFPDVIAMPYMRVRGGDEFMTGLFGYGYKNIDIYDSMLGATPWPEVKSVKSASYKEFKAGDPLQWYEFDTHYEPVGITVLNDQQQSGIHFPGDDRFHVIRSKKNADEVIIDLTFPEGLFMYINDGVERAKIGVWIYYRKKGTTQWLNVHRLTNTITSPKNRVTWKTNSNTTEEYLYLDYKRQLGFTVSVRIEMPVRDEYEFRIGRSDYPGGITDDPELEDKTRTVIRAIQTITHEPPIYPPVPISCFEFEIRATSQISGNIDNFSSLCEAYIPYIDGGNWVYPKWDVVSRTWDRPPTNNHAWVYLELLKGDSNPDPLTDDDIDLPAFEEWALYCAQPSPDDPTKPYLACNFFSTQIQTVAQMLQKVAGAGNATRHIRDGKHSIIWDAAAPYPTQVFTQRNARNFQYEKDFIEIPHGIKVSFLDEEDNYQPAEVIAYAEGYDETNATTFEAMEAFACTERNQAKRAGLRYIAMGKYRSETLTFETDIENIASERGDRIRVSFDSIEEGGETGRIVSVTKDSSGAVTAIRLDQKHGAKQADMAANTHGLLLRTIGSDSHGSYLAVNVEMLASAPDEYSFVFKTPVQPNKILLQEGDLTVYGEITEIEEDWLIKKIDPLADLGARLACTPYAPELQYIKHGGTQPNP